MTDTKRDVLQLDGKKTRVYCTEWELELCLLLYWQDRGIGEYVTKMHMKLKSINSPKINSLKEGLQ